MKTDEGRQRLARMDERLNRYMEMKREYDLAQSQGEKGAAADGPELGGPPSFEHLHETEESAGLARAPAEPVEVPPMGESAEAARAPAEPVEVPPPSRPERVVTDAQKKAEYDRQLREAMRFMRYGAPMPLGMLPGHAAT